MVEVIEFYEIWRIQDINFGSGKLTWKSRPWYLLDRLNSQGRVEKNSKGRFPVSSLFGVQPFLFRISGQVESKVLLQKERGRWNEVRKVVSNFLAIPNSISINHFIQRNPVKKIHMYAIIPNFLA